MPDAITYTDITSIGRCTDRIEFSGAVGQMSSTLASVGIAWPAGIRGTCQLQGRIVAALFTFSAPVRDPHWKQKVETGSSALNTSKKLFAAGRWELLSYKSRSLSTDWSCPRPMCRSID